MHCEALDEVHELKINKKAKSMVVRPTDDNMHRLSNPLPCMARMAAAFTEQLFPECLSTSEQDAVRGKTSATLLNIVGNIRVMIQVATANGMLEVVTENRRFVESLHPHTSKPRAIPRPSLLQENWPNSFQWFHQQQYPT